ncbi:MAG: isopentenyl-diphosphate delta-isomerase [Bdellovibrionales bacterium]
MSDKRKRDHIEMSVSSIPDKQFNLHHCAYEPMLSPHPTNVDQKKYTFLDYSFGMPLWVSSMTGGTEKAKTINENLAKACGEFNLGMGLGSCRPLLESNDRLEDFNVKHLMKDAPLFTNFGIAQLEELIDNNQQNKITDLIEKLNADGLVIHVNPLQEWAQEEGDRFKKPPIQTIETLCETLNTHIIVKEVGQGIGPQSLKALMDLPIAAIELAAYGGTNFSILENRRRDPQSGHIPSQSETFGYIGHTAQEMVQYLNEIVCANPSNIEIIISGGIKDIITGHTLRQSLNMNAIIGMASALLKNAMGEYEQLQTYLNEMQECFLMAEAFIKPTPKET